MSHSLFTDCPDCGKAEHLFVIYRFHTNTQLVSKTSHCKSCRYDDVEYMSKFTEEYYEQLNLPETGFESIRNECLVNAIEKCTGKEVTLFCQRNPLTHAIYFRKALSDFGPLNNLSKTEERYKFLCATEEVIQF